MKELLSGNFTYIFGKMNAGRACKEINKNEKENKGRIIYCAYRS